MRDALVAVGLMAAVCVTAVVVNAATPGPAAFQQIPTSSPANVVPGRLPGPPPVLSVSAPVPESQLFPPAPVSPSEVPRIPARTTVPQYSAPPPIPPVDAPTVPPTSDTPTTTPSTGNPCDIGLVLDPVLGVCVRI